MHNTSIIRKTIQQAWKAGKVTFCLEIIFSILQFITILMEALVPGFFIDSFAAVHNTGTRVVVACGIFICFILLSNLLNGYANYYVEVMWKKVYGYNMLILNKKAAGLSAVVYEDSKQLDEIERARNGADAVGFVSQIYMGIAAFYIPALLSLSIYYGSINIWLMLSIYLAILPNLYAKSRTEKINEEYAQQAGTDKRKEQTWKRYLTEKERLMEGRHWGIFTPLFEKWQESFEQLLHTRRFYKMKSVKVSFLCQCLSGMSYILILGLLFWLFMTQQVSLGQFTAVITSFSTLIFLMDEMINENMMIAAEHMGSIKNYFAFIKEEQNEEMDEMLPMDEDGGITAKDVSFHYPNTQKDVLQHIDVDIVPGEFIAIVGENGSGKTTLAKVLTGIYMPDQGSVRKGNIDTAQTTAVFQDFAKYKFTGRDNITISDTTRKQEDAQILQGLHQIDENMELDLNQNLSKEFGGTELSGGQWQKLALARGDYRKHKLILLDEPTSALDPIREYELYQVFQEMGKNATVLMVTHRLGAARLADRILVMDKGELIETGTHEELLEKGGKYRQMYEAQRALYIGG